MDNTQQTNHDTENNANKQNKTENVKNEAGVGTFTGLFSSVDVIPREGMTKMERMNAMLRFIIIVTIVLFGLGFDFWWQFFIVGVVVVLIASYLIS
jgi:hypothetical protein